MGVTIAVAIGWHFLSFLRNAIGAIQYKYGLDYGEGIVWQQALLIPGPRMYGDITQSPFIVFHYPPVYHLVVRILAAAGFDMLTAGRWVSLVSAFVISAVVARLAFLAVPHSIGLRAKQTGAVIAALTVFCYEPVVQWSVLMRVDMLAIAIGFVAVLLAVTSPGRPLRLYVAAFLFLLAMFTKQTAIAAPLATFPVMLIIDRRRTLLAAAAVLVTGVGLLFLLNEITAGGFIRHIILYNLNRYDFSAVINGLISQWYQAIFLLVALLGLHSIWRGLRRPQSWTSFENDLADNIATRTALVITLYLAITTGMLATIGKSGASNNYLIEGMCVWSVLIGVCIAYAVQPVFEYCTATAAAPRQAAHTLFAISVGAILAVQMTILPTSTPEYHNLTPSYVAAMDTLASRIANTQKPVLSDDMVLLLRAGKDVQWEPAIFAELASEGTWDERLIVNQIDAHRFGMIITTGVAGTPLFDSRFTPAVRNAITSAYPRTQTIARRIIHLPADEPSKM